MQKYDEVAKELGLSFNDSALLKQAFVHRSYLNEHHNFTLDHNERLEFLGDAVLELVVTDFLYRNYPNPEGEMTNWRASLVNSQSLAETGRALNLEKYLLLSKGESKDNNPKARNYILANTVESIIGAIYLDSGYEAAAKFINEHILVKLPNILKNKLYLDAKTHFQELSQEKYGITPNYKLLSEEGPDHNKTFQIGVFIDEEMIAEGKGSSKQEAQMTAAQAAIKAKGWS